MHTESVRAPRTPAVQLKLKFKREEKLHKDLVDAALKSSGAFDVESYRKLVQDALGAVG